ncbi:hypothetical protein GCM10010517_46660 [Streptosporangium fragile]|uniref:Lipoprotein n=1 Tax=Streptosporangium fragile TaxID=46186 RepID=A0ABP6IHC4_9ACTN
MRGLGLFLAVTGLLVAGCAEAGDAGPPSPGAGPSASPTPATPGGATAGGLREMMGKLAADGPAAAYLDYGDMAHWRKLGVVTSGGLGGDSRWLRAVGTGFGQLASSAALLPEPTGINVYGADRAVFSGIPPKAAVRVEGTLDAAAIRAKLTALGAKPRTIGGQEGLSLAADNAIDQDSVQVTKLSLLNQLNQVVVTDSALVAGSAAAPVASALGGGPSLAAEPGHAAVADCLGDVVAAIVAEPPEPGGVALYGVGLRRPATPDAQAVNVVCVLPRVPQVKETFTGKFTVAARTTSGDPLSDLVDGISHDEVTTGGTTVLRATMKIKQDGPVTLAQEMFHRYELHRLADPMAPPDPFGVLPSPS